MYSALLTFSAAGALAALVRASQDAAVLLARHVRGDWGEVDAEDRKLNDAAVDHEGAQ